MADKHPVALAVPWLLVLVACAGAPSSAHASPPGDRADEMRALFDEEGVEALVADVQAIALGVGSEQGCSGEAWVRTAREAFATRPLFDAVVELAAPGYEEELANEYRAYWETPLGAKVRALTPASALDATPEFQAFVQGIQGDPSRRNRIETAKRIEASLAFSNRFAQLHTIASDLARAQCSPDQLRGDGSGLKSARRNAETVNVRVQARGTYIAVLLYIYRSLPDDEFVQLAEFTESEAGRWYVGVLNQALLGATREAAQRIWPTPADEPCEVEFLEENAALGDPGAKFNLAVEDYRGVCAPRDPARRAELWRDLADSGDPAAASNLGFLLIHGMGVEADREAAFRYWEQAAREGHPEASLHMSRAYRNGDPPQLVEALARAIVARELALRSTSDTGPAVADGALEFADELRGLLTSSEAREAETRATEILELSQ